MEALYSDLVLNTVRNALLVFLTCVSSDYSVSPGRLESWTTTPSCPTTDPYPEQT